MHGLAERFRLVFSWIIGLFLIFLITFTQSRHESSTIYEILELTGYCFIVIATLGRIWSTVYIGGRKDDELCKEGPYSITRNPLYIFTFIGAIGIIFSAHKLMLTIIIIPFFIYYYFVIKSEEKRMMVFFGKEYKAYYKRVNRVIPTFHLYSSPKTIEVFPKILFRSMVHSSSFMWIFIIIEFIEYFKEHTNIIPIFFYLPF